MAQQDLFTVGKLAKEWGVPQKEIKNAIAKIKIQPDVKKGACNYFTRESADKIKMAIEK